MSQAAESERNPPPSGATPLRSHVELLAALAKSLHSAGMPAHRLEATLELTAERLGVPIQVWALPTGLMMQVGNVGSPTTVLVRVPPGAVHLERLAQLSAIGEKIASGKLSPPEGKRQIEAVMRAAPRWGKSATVLAYVLSAGAFAVFFGGGVAEIVTAVCVGLAAGLISVTVRLAHVSPRLFELTAAAAAAIIANVAHLFADSLVDWIPLAAGLIILLPGLSMVDAVDELAHGHLTAGASRMAGVGVVLLAMAFGAMLGLTVVALEAFVSTTLEATPVGWWWWPVALAAVSVGSMIRFREAWSHLWVAFVGSVIALAGAKLGNYWLGQFAGPFVAAFILGGAANVFSNVVHKPAQLLTVPGLALLVPGSFGVRSIAALLDEQTTVGVDTAFHMFITTMALVGGLLFSNAVIRDKDPW
jgi:uncharacterized membrane protein YjjP (DUF1212 family)